MNKRTPAEIPYDLLLTDWQDKDDELDLTQFEKCFCDLYGRVPDCNDTRRFLEDQERQRQVKEGHKGFATLTPEPNPKL